MNNTTHNLEPQPLFDPSRPGASLQQLQQLVLPIRSQILSGLVSGETQSNAKGQGYERDDVRDIEPDDEYHHVDQVLTAQHPEHTPQVRTHFRDITPSLWLITDSMRGHNSVNPGYFSEQDLALSVGGAVLLMAQQEGMPSTMLGINDREQVRSSEVPFHGRKNVLQIGKTLVRLAQDFELTPESEQKNLSQLLEHAAQRATQSVVVVVSGFRDNVDPSNDPDSWKQPMQRLRQQGNDILALELTNPWDFELPEKVSRFTLSDRIAFVGKREAQRLPQIYRDNAKKQQSAIDETIAQARAAHIKLSTSDPRWFTSMYRQLKQLS